MHDPSQQVATVVIGQYQSIPNSPMLGEMFAASAAATVPVLVLALVLQRAYVKGMVSSGLK
jgi:ABC-type glycerol-3-phosphate transport system permease component